MAELTATITPLQKYNLLVSFVDGAGNPAPAPGPVVWTLANTALGTLTPTADTFGCQFAPAPSKPGMARITATDPSAPSIPSVEADITVSPLATRMVLTGQATP